MTLKKISLTFALLFIFIFPLRAQEKTFPLNVDVIFSPCFCNERVYIFSRNGGYQTLSLGDNSLNFNLFSLNPLVQPLCLQNKVFVANKDGNFYFLSEEEIKPDGSFTEKIIGVHTFKEKLFIIYENSVKEFDGFEIELPFNATSSFTTEKAIFLSGKNEFAFFKGDKDLKIFPFLSGEIKGAVLLGKGFAVCDEKTIFFLNKNGKAIKKFKVKADIVSLLSVDEDKVAVASSDHFIRLFDRKGTVVWQYRLDGVPLNLIKIKRGLLTGTKGGNSLVLIDPKKGTELWIHKPKEGEIFSLISSDSKAFYYTLKENLEWVLNIVAIPQ